MAFSTGLYGQQQNVKRKVFVSYHHGADQPYYNCLSSVLADTYDVIYDNSLERQIDSDDVDYVMRRIREDYVTGSSCTLVLCGLHTPVRKYVDWEIKATLDKQHALIGVKLPMLQIINDGCDKPARLQDNVTSGYAKWIWWEAIIAEPAKLVEECRPRKDRTRGPSQHTGAPCSASPVCEDLAFHHD